MEEKRESPRIKTTFKIKLGEDRQYQGINLSENGLSFYSDKLPLVGSDMAAQILLPTGERIDLLMKTVWFSLAKNDKYCYGVALIHPGITEKGALRKFLIEDSIVPILEKIKGVKERAAAEKFLTQDFRCYLNKLDEVTCGLNEKQIQEEEAFKSVSEISALISRKGDELEMFLDNRLVMKDIKNFFRLFCGGWVYKSKIIKHGLDKPRGYPGDYMLIERIYDREIISSSGIGACHDNCFLENEYVTALNNRKDKMKEIVDGFISSSPRGEISILNIACGSCREISELLSSNLNLEGKKIIFNLVDQDTDALAFSERAILKTSREVLVNTFSHNVFDYTKPDNKFSSLLQGQDLVYSIGLCDYLPDRFLSKLVLFLFGLVNPGGRLVIAHKDSKAYKPLAPDWWCDWGFYHRSKEEVLSLFQNSGISGYTLNVECEESGVVFFAEFLKD